GGNNPVAGGRDGAVTDVQAVVAVAAVDADARVAVDAGATADDDRVVAVAGKNSELAAGDGAVADVQAVVAIAGINSGRSLLVGHRFVATVDCVAVGCPVDVRARVGAAVDGAVRADGREGA